MALAQSLQPAASESDEELVAALRAGDDDAFAALYHRYAQFVQVYLRQMVGEHGRVDDLTQEAFISAVRRLRSTDAPVAFRPWIYEIARNAAIDELRRRRRRREVPLDLDPDAGLASGRWTSRVETPEAAMEDKQRLSDLRGAFHGLSDSHHRVLVLRELEGRSYAEIGEHLNMSHAVVESTLFRARRKLSHEYRELASGRRCELVQGTITDLNGPELRKLGVRHRRQLTRHLAHCQLCRRSAHDAGMLEHLLRPPKRTSRLGALLGIPWLRMRGAKAHHALTARLSGAGRVYAPLASLTDPPAPISGFPRAAAAVVAVVVAGLGGGAVIAVSGGSPPRVARPPSGSRIPTGAARGGGSGAAAAAPSAARRSGSAGRPGPGGSILFAAGSAPRRGGSGTAGQTAAGSPPAGLPPGGSYGGGSPPGGSHSGGSPPGGSYGGGSPPGGSPPSVPPPGGSPAAGSPPPSPPANPLGPAQGVVNSGTGAVQGVANSGTGAVQGVVNSGTGTAGQVVSGLGP